MGGWSDNLKNAKKIKSQKDKLSGILEDLDAMFEVASHMVKPNVNSPKIWMEHGYAALIRIADLAPTRFLSQYLKYYQTSIGQLGGLFVARGKADFSVRFVRQLTKKANELDNYVTELEGLHKFAYWMVDRDDSKLSKNLPAKFKAHYELEELLDREADALSKDPATRTAKAVLAHSQSTTAQRIKESRSEVGLIIAGRASDLAGAYLVFMKEYQVFIKEVIKVSNYMQELNRSKGSGDRILGYRAQLDAQYDVISGGSNNSDTVLRFMNGSLVHSEPVKKVGDARRRLEKLSKTWKDWAHTVKQNDHMDRY